MTPAGLARVAPAVGGLPRIEMVLPSLVAAGMEVLVARMVRALAARGYDIGVTCIFDGGVLADELRAEGHQVAVVPAPGLRSNVRPGELVDHLVRRAPDIVHVHSGAWLKGARAARLAGARRVICTVHGLEGNEPWYELALMRVAARFTDVIVPVSRPLAEYFVARLGISAAKVRLIRNGIDTDVFAPGPHSGQVRARLPGPPDRLVVGNVARLMAVKNHALLIDAIAILRREMPDVAIAVVGEGVLRPQLEARIAALGLGENLRLLGASSSMPDVYKDFDVFVLSSHLEGTSVSLLEAMASGVPSVATAVGGNSELLGEGRYGVLVPPGDATALASALAALLRDPGRRRVLAASARAHVREEYSETSMLEQYESLYRACAAAHAGAAARRRS